MDDKTLIKVDFIVSLLVILFSGFMIVASVVMPKYEEWGLYATPGLAPFVFAVLLLLSGLIMLIRSLLKQGYRITITWAHLATVYSSLAVQRFVVVLGLILVYALLLGKLHFVLISTVFIFLNIAYFKSIIWWKNLLISGGMAFAVWLLFNVIFLVPLP